MIGNVFAVCMIAVAIAVVVVVVKCGTRPSLKSGAVAVLYTILSFIAVVFFSMSWLPHACYHGGTGMPAVLCAASVGVVTAFVSKSRFRKYTIGLLVVLGIALTFRGGLIVHRRPYTGNPHIPEYFGHDTERTRERAKQTLVELSEKQPDVVLPEGWVVDSLEAVGAASQYESYRCRSASVGQFWHTSFTGLYHFEREWETGVWCIGGTVSNCIETLEIRAKAPNPNK